MKYVTVGQMPACAGVIALFSLLLLACSDDPTGPVIERDAGADLGDAPLDMGQPAVDMGQPVVDMGTSCAPPPIVALPAAELPRCAAATQAIAVACGVPNSTAARTCIIDALNADTTARLVTPTRTIDCIGCFGLQRLACVYAGCEGPGAALLCCLEAEGCTNSDCPACASEAGVFNACAIALVDCFDPSMGEVADCFAAADPDAGVSDAGADAGSDVDAGTDADAGSDADADAGTDADAATTPG